jgi:hypothetical protein
MGQFDHFKMYSLSYKIIVYVFYFWALVDKSHYWKITLKTQTLHEYWMWLIVYILYDILGCFNMTLKGPKFLRYSIE